MKLTIWINAFIPKTGFGLYQNHHDRTQRGENGGTASRCRSIKSAQPVQEPRRWLLDGPAQFR